MTHPTILALSETELDTLTSQFEIAWNSRQAVVPPGESHGLQAAQAYEVQRRWTQGRLEAGETILGRKIGLTSQAIQQQLGVDSPDFGSLWGSRYFAHQRGRAHAPHGVFLQPRIEGEIAFLLGRDLQASGDMEITLQDVLDATDAVAPALEIIDSRVENWRIKIADTIADNASYGGFTVGEWSKLTNHPDLSQLTMTLHHNGVVVGEGSGAAVLGHPAQSVAWLANTLNGFGTPLMAGDIVMSGALSRAVDMHAHDRFTVEFVGLGSLDLEVSE